MPEQRRRFSPQFKAEAVQMVLETGRPITEVARDLGINEGPLGNWVNIWRRDNLEPVPDLSPVERARAKEMEDGIRRPRMENEFLKKVVMAPQVSPGTNENTDGLLCQYFPKGTDLSRWSRDELEAGAAALNGRPRKTLGWKTPAESLDEHLRSLHQAGVATTG
jgi:transposase